MKRDAVIRCLRLVEPDLRASGVDALYLFGSVARYESGPGSDIDIFVDPRPGALRSLDGFMAPYEILTRALPAASVDFGTRSGLSPYVRAEVEREAVRVF